MASKTILVFIVLLFMFPVWIGVGAAIFGIFAGIAGAIFGVIGGIFGAVFGVFGSIIGCIFGGHWNIFTVAVLVIIVVLISRSRKI